MKPKRQKDHEKETLRRSIEKTMKMRDFKDVCCLHLKREQVFYPNSTKVGVPWPTTGAPINFKRAGGQKVTEMKPKRQKDHEKETLRRSIEKTMKMRDFKDVCCLHLKREQ
jgi:hypothetical protein